MTDTIEAVKVHMVADDTRPAKVPPCGRSTTCQQHLVDGTQTTTARRRVTAHALNRRRAVLTVVTSSAASYLCASEGDAMSLTGSPVIAPMVVELTGTDELWIGTPAGATFTAGVIQEYEVT